jgi:hypothetical protein
MGCGKAGWDRQMYVHTLTPRWADEWIGVVDFFERAYEWMRMSRIQTGQTPVAEHYRKYNATDFVFLSNTIQVRLDVDPYEKACISITVVHT